MALGKRIRLTATASAAVAVASFPGANSLSVSLARTRARRAPVSPTSGIRGAVVPLLSSIQACTSGAGALEDDIDRDTGAGYAGCSR